MANPSHSTKETASSLPPHLTNHPHHHHQILVQTPTCNYTAADYERFFTDVGFAEGWQIRQDTESLVSELVPPGVAVHCLYGSGVPTPETFSYSDKFPDAEPTAVVTGDGDGTVNLRSAKQCGRWLGQQPQPVKLLELPGNEHIDMMLNYTTVAYIKNVLFSP
ncbi:hypothetical protein CRUP_001411 [Coryphaenoides rupestris]|nr:hypothetical protein CRUP_001411 [Coryphaenoides rupestris]